MNLFLLFIFVFFTQSIVNGRYLDQDRLNIGQRLNHDDCLVSDDKRFYLCMQNDGNLVIYRGANINNRRAIWASNTNGKGSHPHRLEMQGDGNLVIYDNIDRPTWASRTKDRGTTNVSAIMQSDGNFVVYNNSPVSALWASATQRSSGVDCRKKESWPHDWTQYEDKVLSLINDIRAKGAFCGKFWRPTVSPIRENWKLRRSSRCHAVDMALYDYFDHVDQQGRTTGKRIKETGYEYKRVAENIAKGQRTPRQVVDDWMNSTGHCLNIMADYQEIGIAYINEDYYQNGFIWVQNFGTPLDRFLK